MNVAQKMQRRDNITLILTAVFAMLIIIFNTQATQAISLYNHKIDYQTVMIHFEKDVSIVERDTVISGIDGKLVNWLAPIHVAEVHLDNQNRKVFANHKLHLPQTYPSVEMIEYDIIIQGTNLPNDPDLVDEEKSYAPQAIDVIRGWTITMGAEDVIIAVLDTGINVLHPEFTDRLVYGHDFVNNDDDPTDDHGHGTHVAGIIGAAANNGSGSAGICPRCSIMPVKVLNENNSGKWSYVAQGILHAAENGADVINLSLGSTAISQVVQEAILYAQQQGALVIAAAGNAATDRTFYPAAFDDVLAVSATDHNDKKWSLSNYGAYIDVAAPGNAIYSTAHELDNSYQGYTFMNGTSMAAPHVAGLAGLLWSQDGALTSSEVVKRIIENCDDLGDSGWDDEYGHGRINVLKSLNVVRTNVDNPINNPNGEGNAGNDGGESGRYRWKGTLLRALPPACNSFTVHF